MKFTTLNSICLSVIYGLVCGTLLSCASASAADSTKVKEKAAETASAAGEYAAQSKEDFQKNVREQLDKISAQIKVLKDKAAVASGSMQDSLDRQIADLDVQKLKINRKLNETSKTSGAAWEQMKLGLSKAMQDLKTGFEKAKSTASGSGDASGATANTDSGAKTIRK